MCIRDRVKEDLETLGEDVEALEEAAGDALEDQEQALRKKLEQLEGDYYEGNEADALAAAPAPAPTTGDEEDVAVVEARIDALVKGYTYKELQRELKSRELRAAGKKQELKARLEGALVAELEAAKEAAPMEEDVVEAPAPAPAPNCLLYTSPSPRDRQKSRMPSSA